MQSLFWRILCAFNLYKWKYPTFKSINYPEKANINFKSMFFVCVFFFFFCSKTDLACFLNFISWTTKLLWSGLAVFQVLLPLKILWKKDLVISICWKLYISFLFSKNESSSFTVFRISLIFSIWIFPF